MATNGVIPLALVVVVHKVRAQNKGGDGQGDGDQADGVHGVEKDAPHPLFVILDLAESREHDVVDQAGDVGGGHVAEAVGEGVETEGGGAQHPADQADRRHW